MSKDICCGPDSRAILRTFISQKKHLTTSVDDIKYIKKCRGNTAVNKAASCSLLRYQGESMYCKWSCTNTHSITIQAHDNPDADAIASGYALYVYFQAKGKRCFVDL